MTKTYRILTLAILALLCIVTAKADSANGKLSESEFETLYKQYQKYYDSPQEKDSFFSTSEKLKAHYKQQKDLINYYKVWLTEARYNTNNGSVGKALNTCNAMLEEMKADDFDGYYTVYLALGNIFKSRGNASMAQYYYQKSIENIGSDKEDELVIPYSHIAHLMKFVAPTESKRWNEQNRARSEKQGDYLQVYYFIESCIQFALGNEKAFQEALKDYQNFRQSNGNTGDYGLKAITIMQKSFGAEYDEALALLSQCNDTELNLIDRYDMRIKILEMQNKYEDALDVAIKRAEIIDSLNGDMLFSNLNEINTAATKAQVQAEKSRSRESIFFITMLLALIIIAMLGAWTVMHRKMSRHLEEKNEQLRSALSMAEEADKMKTEFVRSVSHEIRTPLNAISGFNDIVNDPDMVLEPAERADMVNRIKENVQAITDIVDEMLHMAERDSSDFNAQNTPILCNKFLSSLLYAHRPNVSAGIELTYTTRVMNRYTINTNEEGVRQILEQLVQNAIKFTKKGTINMHCSESVDLKYLEISVTDTGCGVAPGEEEKIFQQFHKSNSFQQGIGLGLTVSKKIAQKLGGDLVLDTNYRQGARFILKLPLNH